MDNLELEKLNIATKVKLGEVQTKDVIRIRDVENLKITKVLTVSAKAIVDKISVQNAEVKFDGFVCYDLLVVLENDNIVPISQKNDFSQIFENASINPETIVNVCAELLELNNVSGEGEIVYSSIINFNIYAINQNSDVCCAKIPEDIFIKESEICFDSFAKNIVYDSAVSFEIAKDNKVNKILFITNSASIKSVIPANDYFVVSGEVYIYVVFQSEDGLIKGINKEISFSEEIECAGVTKESIIQAQIKTKETVVTESSEKNIFNFDTQIQVLAQIYNKNIVKCVVDAYSLEREVNLTTTSFEENNFVSTRQIEENILTNFAVSEDIPFVDRILSVIPVNISIVNQIVKKGELILEGISILNLIYYFEDEEGNNILNSLDIEVPYSLNISVSDLEENDRVVSQIVLGDINVKNKRGKDLEILAEAKINYDIIKNNISAITTQVVLGEEKSQKDYNLEIYQAKENQSLWDIAKELNISTADLISQNGELTLPLKSGEKIISYKQRKVDF